MTRYLERTHGSVRCAIQHLLFCEREPPSPTPTSNKGELDLGNIGNLCLEGVGSAMAILSSVTPGLQSM